MKILHLTLKKKWFDMILSGEKKEEYRDISPHWISRFYKPIGDRGGSNYIIQPDIIIFTNGYGKHRPSFEIECKGITYDGGDCNRDWGYTSNVFVIKLGKILNQSKTK